MFKVRKLYSWLFCLTYLSFLGTHLHALEIDEKLTVRILSTSTTAKTVLVNRGIEDGLVMGDHAKFFITVGVVARGVVVKVSPTRSVWSLYRVVNADYIKQDQVLNIKITAPVKITKDESKMIVKDDTPAIVGLDDPRRLGIPLSEGADDLGSVQVVGGIDENELKALAGANVTNIRNLNKELIAGLQLSTYTASTSAGSGDSFGSSQMNADILLAGEFYFKDERQWYGRFSLMPMFKITGTNILESQGAVAATSTREFGGQVNWHPLRLPSLVNLFIPFVSFGMFYGTVQDLFNPGSYSNNASEFQLDGVAMGYAIGGGVKFYTGEGYGARAVIEYYSRTDTFVTNDYGEKWSRTLTGPRVYVAFSYRL